MMAKAHRLAVATRAPRPTPRAEPQPTATSATMLMATPVAATAKRAVIIAPSRGMRGRSALVARSLILLIQAKARAPAGAVLRKAVSGGVALHALRGAVE